MKPKALNQEPATLQQLADRLNLAPSYLGELFEILKKHVPNTEILAYGSRAIGRNWGGSDLDILLFQPSGQPVPFDKFLNLKRALDDSDIPIMIDLHDWVTVKGWFRSSVDEACIRLTQD